MNFKFQIKFLLQELDFRTAMKTIVTIIILLFTAHSFFGQSDAGAEACEVYKAVLGDEAPLVISGITGSTAFGKYWTFSRRNPKLATVQSETVKSYKRADIWCDVRQSVKFENKVTYITGEEAVSYLERSLIDENAQDSFTKKHGTDHYFSFSPVGFNKKRDQALLTMQWQCISLRCTDQFYVVLSKASGEWRVTVKEVIWSS